MKKKLLCACLLLAGIASFTFAQPGPPPIDDLYLSVNFDVPIQWQYYYDDAVTYDAERQLVSLGLDIDGTYFFTRRIGLHASVGFDWPVSSKYEDNWGRISYNRNDYDSWWGVSIFAGPAFAIVRNPRVLLSIAPGIHVGMLFADYNHGSSSSQYTFGLGANLEFMYNFTRHVFVRAAVEFTYDFCGNVAYDGGYNEAPGNIVSLTPAIGVGFRL